MMFFMMVGCDQPRESVQMRGIVTDGPESVVGLAGASLTTIGEDGVVYSTTKTTSTGAFSVDLPSEQMVHALVESDGFEVSSFSGGSGAMAGLDAEVGLLYGLSIEEADQWREAFDGCAGVGSGAMVIGQVKLLDRVSTTSGDPIIVTTAWSRLEDWNGNEIEACYMDGKGEAYDPLALETGASGKFAFFGLDEGLYIFSIGYTLLYFEVYEVSWQLYAPKDGVAPRLPIWVESVL
jgi:hypothetical protein